MKNFKVDLDYESFLFDPTYIENSNSSLKIIREFEYVFFLINKDLAILKNMRSYDKNYLNKLSRLGFFIPTLNPDAKNAESWWGHRHNYALEQDLNSKITSARLALQKKWGLFHGAIIESVEALEEHIKNNPNYTNWIIKRPHGFSGIGHYTFSSSTINKFILNKILTTPVLLEPQHQRLFDIGTTFEVHNGEIKRQFMVENFNSPQGGFKGGAGASSVIKFKKYIEDTYHYALDELEKTTREIANEYLKMGAVSNIQIDSFIYKEDGQLKLYPLVEVNYRKTMGLVIQSLADKYPDALRVEWIVKSKKEIEEDIEFYNRGEMTRLSPDGTHFQTYLKVIT